MKQTKEEKCDYCKRIAKYGQTLEIVDLHSNKKEVVWIRFSCEKHKDICD